MEGLGDTKLDDKGLTLINYKFLVAKFVGLLIAEGKKHKAEKLFFSLLKFLVVKYKKFPFSVLVLALKNIAPLVVAQSVKLKKKSYQVPIPVMGLRPFRFSMCWLLDTCRSLKLTKDNTFISFLLQQIELAFQNKGELLQKKLNTHENAKLGRPFANYRWF